jgi:hypothetical protein
MFREEDRQAVPGPGGIGDQANPSVMYGPAFVCKQKALTHHRDRRFWPERMATDKGYSYPHVRRWMKGHSIRDMIPSKKNQVCDLGSEKAQNAHCQIDPDRCNFHCGPPSS